VKPIIKGTIGGVIAFALGIAGIFAFLGFEEVELENYDSDYLTASEIHDQIGDVLDDLCSREPRLKISPDVEENLAQLKVMEEFEVYLSENLPQIDAKVSSLENQIKEIQDRYSGAKKYYESFNFKDYECETSKYNVELSKQLLETMQ
jgi:hypothetical protein